MMSSRFDLGSTLKTLNLFFLRFNEQSGFQNLGITNKLPFVIVNQLLAFIHRKETKDDPTHIFP